MNESCHTYKWVMAHMCISHSTHEKISYRFCVKLQGCIAPLPLLMVLRHLTGFAQLV